MQLWQTFEQVYKKKYVDVDFRSPTILLEGELFETLKLSKGQSIDDFYAQLLEKATILHKSDHEILIKFINGLPDQLAFFVRAGHHHDSPNCLAAAKMGDAYGYRKDDAPLVAAVTKSANNIHAAEEPGVHRAGPPRRQLNNISVHQSAHVNISNKTVLDSGHEHYSNYSESTESTSDDDSVFVCKILYMPVRIANLEISALIDTGLFVTEENPDLGFTNVVQHQIRLKPDFKPKHQRSYRLTPEKKDILRHHLDELLRQGVIAPVDETEDVPITSPVVLVSKRTNQKGKANTSSKETSLSKFRFCCDFGAEMEPLTRLLKKYERFNWTDEHQRTFQNVKSLLMNSPILAFPNFNLPFRLAVDSCCNGIGYVLYQKINEIDEIRDIRFGSKALKLLGIVTAVLECSSYLRTKPFVIECYHQTLKPLFINQLRGAIYERWIAILQQYNFEIQYKPAREMQVPDALSRCTQETSNAFESPDEKDPYFPYEPENTGQFIVPGGIQLTTLLRDSYTSDSNNLQLKQYLSVCARSTESSHIQDPDKIFNQSTASDTIQDSDKIFEQSTDINDTHTSYNDMSDNEITNNYTKKRDSVTCVDSNEYTPSFAHHCLGACERPHRTLSERLTPFLVKGKPWEDVLPGIVFSMNNTPNQSVGFSPFDIVYGKRPQFPLSLHIKDTDFSSVPKDYHTYLKQQCEKLNIIRTEVEKNSINSKVKMLDRVNKDKIQNISFHGNDTVYLLKEPTGSGQKFKNKFAGPLKSAYERKPNPSKNFMDPVLTKLDDVEVQDHTSMDEDSTPVKDNSNTNYDNLSDNISESDKTRKSDNILFVQNNKAPSRPKRAKKLPARFKDQNFINFSEVDVSSESTSASQLKVKRFLAQKIINGHSSYLAHIVGEPAQHDIWLQENQLGPKAKAKLNSRPPPQI
ncbi:unnamed protein product [Mytilus coruscus]|uniref:Reverse transcriptase/retrotransposon-derived protein RNase H-like domain-containing protein n=1 Tax=Mytilus coruscus TaxID=42192 RepID=A0A6J8EUV0_MYTCO|nr:unnamed protein product [Mytilus coruscus]